MRGLGGQTNQPRHEFKQDSEAARSDAGSLAVCRRMLTPQSEETPGHAPCFRESGTVGLLKDPVHVTLTKWGGSSISRGVSIAKILRCAQNDKTRLLQRPLSHLLRSDVKARRGFAARFQLPGSNFQLRESANDALSDSGRCGQRCTVSAALSDRGRRGQPAWQVETMLKLHSKNRTLTADSLRPAAREGCSGRGTPEPPAASLKPIASIA